MRRRPYDLAIRMGSMVRVRCRARPRAPKDETEILRHELSAELRQNAELQQRITSLEMSHDETRKLIPSPKAVAAEEEARHKFERELREAKRKASVVQGEADSLAEELAASQRKYDKMKSAHDALQRLSKAVPDRSSAEDLAMIKALQSEVTMLSRFSEMASGAHRFARWRLFVSAMKRKRAEHRAATAAAARRPAIAPPELLEQLQARLGGAKRRAVLALVRERLRVSYAAEHCGSGGTWPRPSLSLT